MPQMSRKVLWGVLAAVIVLILGGLFLLFHKKGKANTCNSQFYDSLKKYLQKDAFNQPDGLAVQGFHNKSEGPHDTYEKFVQRSSGVIDIHPEKDSSKTIGRIYPVFIKDFVIGNVFCDENNGNLQWRSVVSVQEPMIHHDKTPSLVNQAIKMFESLGSELGLDLGLGESYVTPCYEKPQWRDETKN